MTEQQQLEAIGERLKALREIEGISLADMAKDMQLSEADYTAYEAGEKDFSFSFLYSAANRLGVDTMDLMTGESPKLKSYTLVKKGTGWSIERRKAYKYQHLAYTFRNKKAEPFLVSVAADDAHLPVVQHSHEGQEFDYVVAGTLEIAMGDGETLLLSEGDSIYYDSSIPHAMRAAGGQDTQFIAVVIK